jgi:hypothetical protein
MISAGLNGTSRGVMMGCLTAVRGGAHLESLHTTAGAAVRRLLADQPNTPAKIAFAWKIAAGAAVGRATETQWRAGVLIVRAKTEAWRREVRVAVPLLLRRLQDLLGPGVVTRVHVEE